VKAALVEQLGRIKSVFLLVFGEEPLRCLPLRTRRTLPVWSHNGCWLFDSPEIIRRLAEENQIDLRDTSLSYYEAHEMEFDGEQWLRWACDPSFKTAVSQPSTKQLEGFDGC
jgi:hypothetical protein